MPTKQERQLERERSDLEFDLETSDDNNVVSRWTHLDNVYYSNRLLELLQKHHGDRHAIHKQMLRG